MAVVVANVTLPAAGAKIAIADDGTQDWQAILQGYDKAGTLTPDSIANPHPVQVGDGTHAMPAADAPARALQVTPGDGTNVTPAGDVAARARFSKVTDGVNVQPTGDVQGRGINVIPGDGVRAMPAGDTQARALQVAPGDGVNSTPAGDTPARSRFQKLTDGTNTAAVKGANTAAVATDPAVVVALSPNGASVKVTDGANTAAVKAASTAPVGADPALVVAVSPNTPLPAALVGGRLDTNSGAWLGSTAPTVGSKTSANSVPVVIASDQASVPVTGIGTAAAAADAVANPTLGLLQAFPSGFNGTTWDRIRAGITAVGSAVGYLNALATAIYNTSAPAPTNGQAVPLQANSVGALKTVSTDFETAILDLTTTCSSSASTTTVSATVTGLSDVTALSIEATLQGPTGGTLDVYLQHSPNGGTDWYDFAHYTQLAAAAAVTTQMYVPALTGLNVTIGKGTAGAPAVALAANTFVGGHPFDAMRMVMVTGAGVTLGKSQIVKLHITRPKN